MKHIAYILAILLSTLILSNPVQAKSSNIEKNHHKKSYSVSKTANKKGHSKQTHKVNNHQHQIAKASWYGPGFHGRKTANGERFNMYAMTAAHKTLPFGTKVRVTNIDNLKSVLVTINDRGPYVRGRIIDLSKRAAKSIGMAGVAKVKLEIVS